MSENRAAGQTGKALYLSAGLAIAWVALAFWRPDTTWHLGPLVAALAVGLSHRSLGVLSRPAAAGAAVAGLTNASLAIIVLAIFDKLQGPALDPFPNVVAEAIVLALIGAGIGFLIAIAGPKKAD